MQRAINFPHPRAAVGMVSGSGGMGDVHGQRTFAFLPYGFLFLVSASVFG